jgi:hypothetical protein
MDNTNITSAREPAAVSVARLNERGLPCDLLEVADLVIGKAYVDALALAEPEQRYGVYAFYVEI